MKKLTGKIALVTGGNSGIGLATAKLFAAEGASVIITGRNQATLDAAVAEIGAGTVALRGEVSSLADLDALFAEVKTRFGGLDILFANAGVYQNAPLEQTTEAMYDAIMGVNAKGVFFTIQKASPLLRQGGSVVICASTEMHLGLAGSSVYAASKAAARAFARNLSTELVGRGIRVNVLTPGATATPLYNRMGLSAAEMEGLSAAIHQMVPMHRFATVEEMARGALFLASDDSSYMLGAELVVDGGLSEL